MAVRRPKYPDGNFCPPLGGWGRGSGIGGWRMWDAITDVPGVLVGQVQDTAAVTGCTVLVFPGGAVGGVDLRGSATGTRELATLSAWHVAPRIHALALAGGSAYGLDAAGGVMQALEEQGIGWPTRAALTATR